MRRRVRAARWLFEWSRLARTLFVLVTWPIVRISDRLRHGPMTQPARLADGLHWARTGRSAHTNQITEGA